MWGGGGVLKVKIEFSSEIEVFQTNPRVRKIFVRNSGAGNGCVNFMDAWKMRSFCRNNHVHKIPRLGGGGILGFGGEGQCRFYFYGRADFSEFHQKVGFLAAPVMGRNFLTPGHPGVRVRNIRRKFGPKSLCLCCFFFPERDGFFEDSGP